MTGLMEFGSSILTGPTNNICPAFATDHDVRNLTRRPALIDPQLAPAGVAVAVCESRPVDVANMAIYARLHEANRNNLLHCAIAIAIPSLLEGPIMNQSSRANLAAALVALHQKPFGKQPCPDSSLRSGRRRWIERRLIHANHSQVENACNL